MVPEAGEGVKLVGPPVGRPLPREDLVRLVNRVTDRVYCICGEGGGLPTQDGWLFS